MVCDNCGETCADTDIFCGSCGSKLNHVTRSSGLLAQAIELYESKQYAKAVQIFNELSNNEKDGQAFYYLGHCYENGQGVIKDQKTARKMYLESGNNGYGKGYEKLGLTYLYGIGGGTDANAAIEAFNQASLLGTPCDGFLSRAFYIKKDYEKAFNFARTVYEDKKISSEQRKSAAYVLSQCYYFGFHVPKDHKRSWKLAIEAGRIGFLFSLLEENALSEMGLGTADLIEAKKSVDEENIKYADFFQIYHDLYNSLYARGFTEIHLVLYFFTSSARDDFYYTYTESIRTSRIGNSVNISGGGTVANKASRIKCTLKPIWRDSEITARFSTASLPNFVNNDLCCAIKKKKTSDGDEEIIILFDLNNNVSLVSSEQIPASGPRISRELLAKTLPYPLGLNVAAVWYVGYGDNLIHNFHLRLVVILAAIGIFFIPTMIAWFLIANFFRKSYFSSVIIKVLKGYSKEYKRSYGSRG